MPHLIVLLYSPIYMFIPTLSICLLVIVIFCYLYQSSLLTLGNSHNPLMSVQLMLSFFIQVYFIPVPVLYRLYHTV